MLTVMANLISFGGLSATGPAIPASHSTGAAGRAVLAQVATLGAVLVR